VALASFFVASLVATRLVVRARNEAQEAEARTKEISALYALSIDLFTATNRVGALGEAAARALANVGAGGGGLILFGSGPYDQRTISWSGPPQEEIEDLIAGIARHKATVELPAMTGRDVYLPLKIGGNIIGVLAARGTNATVRALESAIAERIKHIPLNIDGALAAILHDLGFPPLVGKLLFIVSRVAGLSAEVLEEYTREKPMRFRFEVDYDGPPPHRDGK